MNKILMYVIAGFFTILTAVIGYIASQNIEKLAKIETEVVSCRIELTKIQSTLLSKQDIRDLVQKEIYEYHRNDWKTR